MDMRQGTPSILADLLAECDAHGIRLALADGDGLTIDAPQAALTPDLLARLKAHKADLRAMLRSVSEVAPAPPRATTDAPATPTKAGMYSDQKQEVRVHIRWMLRRDMPEVLDIEAEGFEFPWLKEDFIRCLRQRNCLGMVAEHENRVVGYMIYRLYKNRIHVLNFAVAADYCRRGVGSQMVAVLLAKLVPQRRSRIVLEVRETNLAAQLFFRENGFRAVSVLRAYYQDTYEDAYRMQLVGESLPDFKSIKDA